MPSPKLPTTPSFELSVKSSTGHPEVPTATPIVGSAATVEFCGERQAVLSTQPFVIGREGDLAIDDNPYLHRHFLQLHHQDSLWLLTNLGSQLTATIADSQGTMQAWLAPSARLPLIFKHNIVWFTAGPTTYEFEILIDKAAYTPAVSQSTEAGVTTIGPVSLTPDQLLLVVALCEHSLLRGDRGAVNVPTSAQAAQRLSWPLTKFNRKLDNVCQKLARDGVRGLHGGPEHLAVNRRARLVEFALATRLVERRDLALLGGGSR
jgi:hypothetical protein